MRLFNFGKNEYLKKKMTDDEQVLTSTWREWIGGQNTNLKEIFLVLCFYSW